MAKGGGAFDPASDYDFTGTVTFPNVTPTISGATLVTATGTQALTNKTLTVPVINGGTNSALKSAFSTATVSAGYAADTYLAGSGILIPTGGYVAGSTYTCVFDMVKTNAGSAQFTITLRIGTGGGVVGDTSIASFAFAVGTAAVDSGIFTVTAHFRTVGSGTGAVIAGVAECSHALAATGLITTGASGFGQIATVSSGFDSTIAATTIGLSVNGGASFSGTNSIVETTLRSF